MRYEVRGIDGTKHGPYATRGEALIQQGKLGAGSTVKTITAKETAK